MKRLQARRRALAAERHALQARAGAERARLAAALAPADAFSALGARVGELLRWMSRRPLAVGVATALLVGFRPRPLLAWLLRGLTAWRVYQELRLRFALPGLSFHR